jgi:hypothetical protein
MVTSTRRGIDCSNPTVQILSCCISQTGTRVIGDRHLAGFWLCLERSLDRIHPGDLKDETPHFGKNYHKNVSDNAHVRRFSQTVATPGRHTLKTEIRALSAHGRPFVQSALTLMRIVS